MQNFINNLLSENGTISCVRFIHIVSTFVAASIAIIGLIQNRDLSQLSILCGSFIVPASAAKVFQKNVETKNETA